jgi:hypothetical protein
VATLVYRTIASRASLGPLVTPTGIASYVTNQAVGQAEAAQPEGTRIQLLVPNLGDFAQPAANALQAKFLTGQFRDPATGTPIIPWPESPDTVADVPTAGTLRVRWVKGEWQIELVIVLAVLVVGYLLIQALHNSPWTMQAATAAGAGSAGGTGTPVFGGTPFRILYLPWYDAAAIGVAAIVTPFLLRQLAKTEEAEAEAVRSRRALQAAEGGR